MRRVLILEDEKNTLEWLKKIVKSCGDVEVFACDNAADAYKCAMETTVDLFMADIILDSKISSDTSGLKFIDSMRQIPKYSFTPVLFVTSLEDPKLYSYEELHCYKFIEKPFDEEWVRKQVNECLRFGTDVPKQKMLYLRKDGIIIAIRKNEIVYVEMLKQKLYLHKSDGSTIHVPYMSMSQINKRIDNPDMVQCRRNIIVNTMYISNIDIVDRVIQLKNGMGSLEIGLTYKQRMKDYFDAVEYGRCK